VTLHGHKFKHNIAWLIEPPAINAITYTLIMQISYRFDLILTYNRHLLELLTTARFIPGNNTMISPEKTEMPQKSKSVCMIVSPKSYTHGQSLRHFIVENFTGIDFHGWAFSPFEDKAKVLSPYRFAIEVENQQLDYYWTEKLTDCFACGVIPIYRGSKVSASKWFDDQGILFWDTLDGLRKILKEVHTRGEELYQEKLKSVQENCTIVKESQLSCLEDWIATVLEENHIGR
jgi:hypothetical protein